MHIEYLELCEGSLLNTDQFIYRVANSLFLAIEFRSKEKLSNEWRFIIQYTWYQYYNKHHNRYYSNDLELYIIYLNFRKSQKSDKITENIKSLEGVVMDQFTTLHKYIVDQFY